MTNNTVRTLVVIGGGAAGFFCAINAAAQNRQLKVILLEKSDKLLSKVKISGGGRCNVTHACFSISDMAKKYPRGEKFVKKTFHTFFTQDTIDWFASRGVTLKAEADGRMFPVTDSSQTIIDCLLQQASRYGVDIRLRAGVNAIQPASEGFSLQLADGRSIAADYVTVACGGYPKAAMFGWLEALGHSIVAPVPSLFTFNIPQHPIVSLMGISLPEAQVKINGSKLKEQGPLLITHWGLSGPAILRLSAWGARELQEKNWHFDIQVNWLPAFNEESLRADISRRRQSLGAQQVRHRNPFGLPSRLWEFLLVQSEVPADCRWAELPARAQNLLIRNLCAYPLAVKGKTTYKEEFVTAGGIQLNEVDAGTMMSKKVPNLFFAGEILDIDGITGGFNFQNAWTTSYIAAQSIARS
ncbi:BaiN/RdsA family NAD(P)/FAD-dependent oxidoreductase [Taibaiella koreensis]|uniref:NAD(P)/FAD-dependent oxidoreductase n=1 Tax=Taibaiella koreensis TaxID=1268548 RepID=UPI000E59EB0A|nr:NAD(P)/FAD-dependent oxidoreductase [Taibaiella koreensis]